MKKTKQVKKQPRTPERPDENELARAKVFGGYIDPELSSQIEEKFGIPNTFLTEKQWDEISIISGLPLEARFEINIALKRYWYSYWEETVSPETHTEIARVHGLLEDALLSLAQLTKNPDLFKGQIIHFDQSAIEQRIALERTCDTILPALRILSNAQDRLASGRGAKSYGPLYELIHHLDFVFYKCLGTKLRRSDKKIPSPLASGSPKQFVWIVLQAANLQVAESTMDTILRDYIHDRDKHGREYGPAPV